MRTTLSLEMDRMVKLIKGNHFIDDQVLFSSSGLAALSFQQYNKLLSLKEEKKKNELPK